LRFAAAEFNSCCSCLQHNHYNIAGAQWFLAAERSHTLWCYLPIWLIAMRELSSVQDLWCVCDGVNGFIHVLLSW
jgi:hypothetical protein